MAGFECEFVEKPPKAFQCECPICLQVLREPYQATCCGNSFCRQCADRAKARNLVCPTCNGRNFNLFHNLGLQRSLYDFRVYCTHKSKGCEWKGELRELDNHLNLDPPADKVLEGCSFALIKCPLSCPGCVVGLPRKNYKSHINDNIDKLVGLVVGQAAVVKCFEQENMQLKARLVNIEGDKQYLEQRVMELEAKIGEHDGRNERLETKNKELEKKVKQIKGQLSHSGEDKQYLEQQVTELLTKVIELDKKFKELAMKNRESENEVRMNQPAIASSPQPGQPTSKQQPITHVAGTYKPVGAEFTMTNFEEYRRDNDMWYSPHFFTHPNGYKMCLKVFANGNGPGKDTHISVYVYLMQGEFDDQLKWPFHGDITLKLVNQEEDRNHVVDIIKFSTSTPIECRQRVMKVGRSGTGHGCGKFLPHSELQSKYLKNDCIKLCIKRVEIF